MTTEQFLACLAETETNDNPRAWGDNGRAIGRFQVHPDWVHTQEVRFGLQPVLNETWDSFITRLVTKFFELHIGTMDEQEVAMYFHLGHRTLPTDADWDTHYAERFQGFAADYAHG
jgi:hypothetical protein